MLSGYGIVVSLPIDNNHHMMLCSMRAYMGNKPAEKLELLQGTLDMMVLRTLSAGPANGYEIAKAIERLSDDVLAVDHGSLYPALQRLEKRRCDQRQMGNLFHQPASQILPANRCRAQTSCGRAFEVGADGSRYCASDAAGLNSRCSRGRVTF